MKPLEPDWDSIEDAERQRNTEKIPCLLKRRDRGLMEKIKKFSIKHKISEEEIREEIGRSRVARAAFAKDPSRQNLYEGIAKRFLEEHLTPLGVTVRKLPAKGKNALYIDQSGKIRGKSEKDGREIGKSLDFEVKLGGQIVYISHKFTRESGGSQDSQSDEQLEKLGRFKNSNDPQKHFAAACDGEYYVRRMSELKALARKQAPFSTAGTCGEVLEFIREMFNINQARQPRR